MFKVVLIFGCAILQVWPMPLKPTKKDNDEPEKIVSFENHEDSMLVENLLVKVPEVLTRRKRNNGKVKSTYRWPNATVPVEIDSSFISKSSC